MIESRESIEARLKAVKEKYGDKLICHKDYKPRPAHMVPYSLTMQKVLLNAIKNGVIM